MALLAPSRSTMLSPISFHPPTLMDPHVVGGTTRRSRRPDWVLLHKSARISAHRNTTTAGCHTMEGQTIEVSFWLVDPPGVSYFSVHCPGLNYKDLADEPKILCAEAAFVLFSVTFVPVPRRRKSSTQHFVYIAGPGNPSLHLIPDPDNKITRPHVFGLLPFGDTRHYALVFLTKHFDEACRFHVHAFSSMTQSWSSKVPMSGLSEDDHKLLPEHATCKQITIGASSLGWVDLLRGILLLCDVFGDRPVIKYMPLPASRVCQTDDYGHPYIAPDYCCDVSCHGNLIKFVEIEFDDPARRTRGDQAWKATTWDRMMITTDSNWRKRFTVDAASISVDQRYSDLLPRLWNDDSTEELELKKLIFYNPTLSKHDDNFLYVTCKANDLDDKAWVITLDMEHAAVEAIAPCSTRGRSPISWHCPCTFPKYLDLTPGDDVTMHSKGISVGDFVLQVLLTRDWFKELDTRFKFERPTYAGCILLLHCSPVSSLLLDIQEAVKSAFYAGLGGDVPVAVDFCARALEDFDMLLRKVVSDPLSSTEALRSKISVALRSLDSMLNIVRTARVLGVACHPKRDEIFELCEKPGETEDNKLQGYLDANLSHRKKASHTNNDSRMNKKKRARGRKANHSVVGPGRHSRSPSYLLIFVCMLAATFILIPIIMKSLGQHPSM